MTSPPATAAVLVVGLALLTALTFVLAFRLRLTPVLTLIRRLNRRVLNPRQLGRDAGQPGAYASIVHHTGRTTGRPYRTPVVAVPSSEGFAIVLPYGPGADWVRNVLSAGRATLVHGGQEVGVDRPVVVPLRDVAHLLPAGEQRTNRLFGLREALVLRHQDVPVSVEPTAADAGDRT